MSQPKTLLLITGPQGSGNHLYSKIFALHPRVFGWKDLNDTYWISHDQEPFNRFWVDPSEWDRADFGDYQHACASISVPYVQAGATMVPPFADFIAAAGRNGWRVRVAIIGRDINILQAQQQRLRSRVTLPLMLEALERDLGHLNPDYISHEMLCLYQGQYLRYLSKILDFPIAWDDARVADILKDNANAKYVRPVTQRTDLDVQAMAAMAQTARPGTEWYAGAGD